MSLEHGRYAIAIDDGSERSEIMLDPPDVTLRLSGLACSYYRHSSYGVLLVLASDIYDTDDYIRHSDGSRRIVYDG